jgi:hypothetical protein
MMEMKQELRQTQVQVLRATFEQYLNFERECGSKIYPSGGYDADSTYYDYHGQPPDFDTYADRLSKLNEISE